jgi:molybdopterin-guanine dinucleotide biosynthesis protein A
MSSQRRTKALILAGGLSTRMRTPKALLTLSSQPLYLRAYTILATLLPHNNIYLSLRYAQQSVFPDFPASNYIYDELENIGPAAALIAAHKSDPDAHWLVLAVDFPFVERQAVEDLLQEYAEPVTAYENVDGFLEPLWAVWGPGALEILRVNVESGKTGPNWTARAVGCRTLSPREVKWVFSANTPEEWEQGVGMWGGEER